MTETESLIAEVRQLRADVARLHAAWLKLGIFITLLYSIYANLATDYGAMSAAEAAFGEPQPPPIPLEPPTPQPPM